VRSRTLFLTLLTVTGVVPLSGASANEWVVAADGSGQFTDIQPAVDAAQSGDVIWVLPGLYGVVDIIQKTLRVIGAGAESTTVGSVSIGAVPPGIAVLSGMTIAQQTSITANQGTVVLRDCIAHDLALSDCKQVFLENWQGTHGTSDSVDALWIATSHFEGSAGNDAVSSGVPDIWSQLPTPGTTAFVASKSKIFATGSDFTGGSGGQGSCLQSLGYVAGAVGGNGLEDATGDCSLWLAKCTFTPGIGGSGDVLCTESLGSSGLKTTATTKLTWDDQGADLFPLWILAPSLIGQSTTIQIWGQPGDSILLLIATNPATSFPTTVAGFPLGLDLTSGFVNFWPLTRTIAAAGYLTWKHIIPSDPLLLGTPVFVQALLAAPLAGPWHPPTLTSVSESILSE
jgi:hypothetical protein